MKKNGNLYQYAGVLSRLVKFLKKNKNIRKANFHTLGNKAQENRGEQHIARIIYKKIRSPIRTALIDELYW